jgi:hypothetical protein
VEGNGGDPPAALLRNLPEGAGETTFFPKIFNFFATDISLLFHTQYSRIKPAFSF